jgi:hypothetical protein
VYNEPSALFEGIAHFCRFQFKGASLLCTRLMNLERSGCAKT